MTHAQAGLIVVAVCVIAVVQLAAFLAGFRRPPRP